MWWKCVGASKDTSASNPTNVILHPLDWRSEVFASADGNMRKYKDKVYETVWERARSYVNMCAPKQKTFISPLQPLCQSQMFHFKTSDPAHICERVIYESKGTVGSNALSEPAITAIIIKSWLSYPRTIEKGPNYDFFTMYTQHIQMQYSPYRPTEMHNLL